MCLHMYVYIHTPQERPYFSQYFYFISYCFFIYVFVFNDMHLCLCLYEYVHLSACTQEGIVTGDCEPDVGAGNQAQVPCESSKGS